MERRRREARWRRPRGLTGPDLAVALLRSLVPDEEHRVAEELVWLRVAIGARRATSPPEESVAALRAEHAVAFRGYVDDRAEAARTDAASQAAPVPDVAVAERLAGHAREREHVVAEALAAIGVQDEAERRRTVALVDGLVLAGCLGRTSHEEASAAVEHHVTALAQAATAA